MQSRTSTRGALGIGPVSICCALLIVISGCAPTQLIGLSVEPEPVVLFIDGEPVDGVPVAVELTANKDHTLYFKREGYRPQLIVVRTAEDEEGNDYLSPERIEITLKRAATSAPGITVELEDAPAEVPDP